MSSIILENVNLNYPLLGAYNRSLKKTLLEIMSKKKSSVQHEKISFIDALKDISFELHKGDRLGLIGHNGAGKSTLLKVLAGIYPPSNGKIQLNGSISPLLGISVGMNPHSTGYENIELRCLLHGFNKKRINEIITEIEDFTELGHFLSMPIKTYSSGMNLRLAFGIATAMVPDILLIDEVVGVGDANFIKKAQDRLNGLIASSKILVLSSHSNEIIQKFCNKILWLEKGRIVLFEENNVQSALKKYMGKTSQRRKKSSLEL